MITKKFSAILLALVLTFSVVGCSTGEDTNTITTGNTTAVTAAADGGPEATTVSSNTAETTTIISTVEGSILETSEFFTDRDLDQMPDLAEAVSITLKSNEDVTISEEGVYVFSGAVEEVSIMVDTDPDAKVQLVLDGVSIVNSDVPAIYVKTADKVFVTSTDSDNHLEVIGYFSADGDVNLDAVIYSKSDLTLNGLGTLNIISTKGNGVSTKDDLKITGGTYNITSAEDAIEAKDSIRIYDGLLNIVTNKDGLHSENEADTSLGYIYIMNGTINITASDDAIHGTSIVQIDGGVINIDTCYEGIEATYIQINGGDITLYATDDGINATNKSPYDVVIEVNGGTLDVTVGSGDTDGFDSNGSIYINGGTISVNATSSFDADVSAELNGGTVTVNGEVITEIVQMQMGGNRNK